MFHTSSFEPNLLVTELPGRVREGAAEAPEGDERMRHAALCPTSTDGDSRLTSALKARHATAEDDVVQALRRMRLLHRRSFPMPEKLRSPLPAGEGEGAVGEDPAEERNLSHGPTEGEEYMLSREGRTYRIDPAHTGPHNSIRTASLRTAEDDDIHALRMIRSLRKRGCPRPEKLSSPLPSLESPAVARRRTAEIVFP